MIGNFCTPTFPDAGRRALLRFEKALFRALAQLHEDLAAACYLEYAVRAEADAQIEAERGAAPFGPFGPHGPTVRTGCGTCPRG